MSLSGSICKMGTTSEVSEELKFSIVPSEQQTGVRYFLPLTKGLDKH